MSDESDFEKELEKYIAELSEDISEKQKERARERNREYNSRPEVKARAKEYWRRPENKERAKKLMKKWLQKPENKERQKKYRREYWKRPETKAKRRQWVEDNKEKIAEKQWEYHQKKKLLNTNPHEICILLGKKTGIPSSLRKNWNIKCTFCSVTYPEKERQENYFIKKFTCPCCKRKLKTFKTKQHNKKRISNN